VQLIKWKPQAGQEMKQNWCQKQKKTATTSLLQREKTNYEQAASGVKHPGLCSSVKQMLLNIAA
jgi:hypothetical protein